MRLPSLAVPFTIAILAVFPLLAQDAIATPASIPAPRTAAALQLVDKGIEKMLAVGRGTWKTHETQDSAMLRGAGLPFGGEGTEVEGGWHGDLLWGEIDGDHYVRNGGRMVVKAGESWKLRVSKLASGRAAPFTLDPVLFFTALRAVPADARQVEHSEEGQVAGKKVAVLSLTLDGEHAADLVDAGAVPEISGGMGAVIFGGMGGLGVAPEIERTLHLALFVDPDNGDVLRVSARLFEKNPMFGNIQIQVQGPGGGNDAEDEDEDEQGAGKEKDGKAATEWKNGLPTRKPAKDESVMALRADFTKLGMADAPALDDKAKSLLRVR